MSVLAEEGRIVSPMETKAVSERSDMEDTVTDNTKVLDSGYSNSYSNSQSQRSGSSKWHHSGSSSGSSGYCGHPSTLGSSNDSSFQRPSTTKRKEHKKKKMMALAGELLNDSGVAPEASPAVPLEAVTLPPVTTKSMEPALLTSAAVPTMEKENVPANTLAHPTLSLDCLKKLKGKDIVNVGEDLCEVGSTPVIADIKSEKKSVDALISVTSKEEFCAVVSMQEGVVLYTTSSLMDVLGYPKDMWLGRSLIDFIHPKDREAFNSHITECIASPLVDRQSQDGQSFMSAVTKRASNTLYCCLRQYRGLKSSGFGVVEKKVSYLPCRLTFSFREISKNRARPTTAPGGKAGTKPQADQTKNGGHGAHAILLVIKSRLIRSAYKNPDEICTSQSFATQHSTTMSLTHVDPEVVPYFGYLPQDMLRRSVFDFYHPEDLPYLKEVYKNVFKDKGQPFNSKPYRIRTQNGTYTYVVTEWSSFINPWTKKLEFVIGQHRVIKGPSQPDVTTPISQPEILQLSEEVIKESNAIKEEIINLLSGTAQTSDASKRQMTKYCKELLTFMENFLDDKTNVDKAQPVPMSISDRDSVMLGEISPHHEYCDSKSSSSETPPSYTQLNYNDNIQRFFESKPKTTVSTDESGDSKTSSGAERNAPLSGEEGKISPVVESSSGGSRNSCLNNESGGSSDLSSGSRGNNGNPSDVKKANSYRTPHLTEALLCKHNENMEKKMVQKHRERSKSDREHKLKDNRQKKNYNKILEEQGAHGVKRSGSHSWEGEPYKSIKQCHMAPTNAAYTTNAGGAAPKPINMPQPPNVYAKPNVTATTNVTLLPPFSMTVTPMHNTQPCATHLSYTAAAPLTSPMMPLYYIPPEMPANRPTDQPAATMPPYAQTQLPYVTSQAQYVSSMMYHPFAMPMFGTSPVMYSPLTMLPTPLLPTQPMKPCTGRTNPPPEQKKLLTTKTLHRPSSQATSVKAEPGSALCSIASNSLRQAMSETSKREGKSLCTSPQSEMSQNSTGSNHGKQKLDSNCINDVIENAYQNDSSSYYSSFYSYMKSDEKSDESMKSLTENDSSGDQNGENNREQSWRKRFGLNGNEVPRETIEKHIRKEPPWMEDVKLTPDLILRYKVNEKVLSEVLENDLKLLGDINQPLLVNEQLCQLYLDLDSFNQTECSLETSIGLSSCSTSSGEADETLAAEKTKKKEKAMKYDKMVMMFEENAPMPPPLQSAPVTQMPCSSSA